MTVLAAARVVTNDAVLEPGWVAIEGSTILAVGSGNPPTEYGAVHDLGTVALVPGFVDMHCHGGGGHWMIGTDPVEIAAAGQFHLRHGTTTMLAGAITVGAERLPSVVKAIGEVASDESNPIIGSHLEGPWISISRCGAHDTAYIREPDPQEWAGLDHRWIRMVTYAPELAGADRLAASILDIGAVAAVGHSDATYAIGAAALSSGSSVGTHLFNAMSPLGHREPGLVGACLEGAICELILDLHHVSAPVARIAFAAAAGRVALVTDAVAPAGLPDGTHEILGGTLRVVGGAAWLGQTLAGSTLTMSSALSNAVSIGVPLIEACRAASSVPAGALGLNARGVIAAGLRADLVALSRSGTVEAVWRAGVPVSLRQE